MEFGFDQSIAWPTKTTPDGSRSWPSPMLEASFWFKKKRRLGLATIGRGNHLLHGKDRICIPHVLLFKIINDLLVHFYLFGP